MAGKDTERKNFFRQLRGKNEAEKAEMTFLDHLEVLRWHIIRAVFALLIAGIVIFIKIDWVFDHLITAPSRSDFISYSALCNFGHRS